MTQSTAQTAVVFRGVDPRSDTQTPFLVWRTQRPWYRVLAIVVCLFVTGGVSGQQGGGPVNYRAGDLFLGGSRVYTHVYKTGLGHEHAVIGQLKSGFLSLEGQPRENGSVGELVFDITSFIADTETARKYIGLEGTTDADTQKQVTANMLSADVLDAKKFPTATFKVQAIKKLEAPSARGLPQYEFTGEFTLHGVTQPLRFEADVENEAGWTRVRGSFAIQQTQYGIKPYKKAFGAVGVADRLEIFGDLWVAPSDMTVQP